MKYADEALLKQIHNMIGNNKVVIDAGANHGWYSKYFLDVMKAKKVYAYEILPDVFSELYKNLSEYGDRVDLNCVGLSAKESEVEMIGFIPDSKGAYWFWYSGEKTTTPKQMGYGKHQHKLKMPEIKLPTKPLDSFKIADKISFIKIDVEGMEIEVLEGGRRLISRDHPVLYVEVCRKNRGLFRKWCMKYGYTDIRSFGPCRLVK